MSSDSKVSSQAPGAVTDPTGADPTGTRSRGPGARGRSRRLVLTGLVGVAVVLFLTAGAGVWGPFPRTLLTYGLIAAVLALSLELLVGFTGYISFGHAAWYGVGAYSTALFSSLVSSSLLLGLLVGAAAAAVGGLLTGLFMSRVSGVYFAILSLAVSQVFYALVFVFSDVTGGEDGYTGVPIPTVVGIEVSGRAIWFWLVSAVVVALVALFYMIRRSPLGRTWSAIKSNETRVKFVGVDPYWYKVGAWVASASLAGLAGGLSVFFTGAFGPESMDWHYSGEVLMYVILGGAGTIVGPVIGAIIFGLTEHYLTTFTDSWLIFFGLLAVVSVLLLPRGYGGAVATLLRRGGR